jgi:cytochrome P450
MSRDELHSNAAFLTLAGSETTSSTSAVAIYFIATRPDIKTKLTKELLSTFAREDEINLRSAAKLPYLMAVIEESMRYHPPGPNALWRITPSEGNQILGDWIPGNVSTVFTPR